MNLVSRRSTVSLHPLETNLTDSITAINRLDRLTSGLMIVPLNADLARSLSGEFVNGLIRKEYIARCKGEFPA
jgi:23S rRNA-/tRNA-specific pseudouridylate synthase